MKRTLFLLAFLTTLMVNAQTPFESGIRLPNASQSDTISDNTQIPIMQANSGNLINKYVNVSDIAGSLSGFVPTTRTITINGVEQDLSANRTWNVGDVLTSGSYSNPSWITGLAYSKITGVPDFLRADETDQKTSGDLLFYNDVEAEFGNTNPMGISGNNTINTIRLNSKDLQITDNVTQRFLFNRASGNFTNSGTITSMGLSHTLGSNAGSSVSLNINAAAGQFKDIIFSSGGSLRWIISSNNTAESGSNLGSNFLIRGRDDSGGSLLTAAFFINRDTGNTSIGNTNNTYKLDVTGTGRFTSTVTATDFILSSDRRLKKKITPYKVVPIKWKLKNYVLKSDESNKETIGVIAQQLERNHPEFVETNEEGIKGVNYIKLLLAKVAELEQRIEELENR